MFLRDFFLAWRKLVRRPGAAWLAIVSLGLAIGFCTAAFSVVDAWYWRAMPVKEPGRLAYAMVRNREGRIDGLNWAEFQAIQQQARTLDGIMVQNRKGPVVKLPDRDDFPTTAGVSDNFFDVLGVGAAMGRVFHAGSGADGQLVLSDRYWRTAFGGDPAICGHTLSVGGAALAVIGVLPPGFSGSDRGNAVDLFVPHQTHFGSLRMGSPADAKDTDWEPLIRLKTGVTLETARRDVDQVLRRREAAGLAHEAGRTAAVSSFTRPEVKPATNFAGLRLIENQSRRRETGVRLALGAGRAALLRQHLSESLLLAGAGTALGLLLAAWLIDFAPALLYAGNRYREYFIRLDARVFAFSAGAISVRATAVRRRDLFPRNRPRRGAHHGAGPGAYPQSRFGFPGA